MTDFAHFTLRPYQEAAKQTVHNKWKEGIHRQIVALATGLGKTIVGASIIDDRGGRALFLVHRDELAQQALETLGMVCEPHEIGLVKAQHNQVERKIIVASVQTLRQPKRMKQLLAACDYRGVFKTIVCDEAHHSVSNEWQSVLGYLDAANGLKLETQQRVLTLGLTATPERMDSKPLGAFWQAITYQMGILDGITSDPPYLVDLRSRKVGAWTLDGVKASAGDYSDSSLEDALLTQHGPQSIVAAWQQYASDRKTLIFLPTIAIAQLTLLEFQTEGISAAIITAQTPEQERRELIRAFRLGQLPVLCNVGVLTEGFDAPAADCIIIARPTKSKVLYTQMVGRGTRKFPGKRDCLILDMVGASDKHKLAGIYELTNGEIAPKDGESIREALKRGISRDLDDFSIKGSATDGESNLFASLPWSVLADGLYGLLLPGFDSIYLKPDDNEHCVGERVNRDGSRESLWLAPIRLDYAQGLVEDMARREGWWKQTRAAAPWRQRPATERERSQLRQRLDPMWNDPGLTSGDARKRLDELELRRNVAVAGKRQSPW